MKRFSRALALLLTGATLLSGCSMLTAQGRRERAYAHYVAKASHGRVKQQKRFATTKSTLPIMQPTEPMETTESSGPESAGNGSGQ